MDKNQIKKEVERVKNSINISFDDYLTYFIGLKSQEEYGMLINQIKKQKLNDFPDLFSVKLENGKEKDVATKVEPLASTNTIYMLIFKYLQTNKYKRKLYSTTVYDDLLIENLEQEENNSREELKTVKEFFDVIGKTTTTNTKKDK